MRAKRGVRLFPTCGLERKPCSSIEGLIDQLTCLLCSSLCVSLALASAFKRPSVKRRASQSAFCGHRRCRGGGDGFCRVQVLSLNSATLLHSLLTPTLVRRNAKSSGWSVGQHLFVLFVVVAATLSAIALVRGPVLSGANFASVAADSSNAFGLRWLRWPAPSPPQQQECKFEWPNWRRSHCHEGDKMSQVE